MCNPYRGQDLVHVWKIDPISLLADPQNDEGRMLTLGGPDGLELIEERFLKNPDTEFTYVYSTIMSLRWVRGLIFVGCSRWSGRPGRGCGWCTRALTVPQTGWTPSWRPRRCASW